MDRLLLFITIATVLVISEHCSVLKQIPEISDSQQVLSVGLSTSADKSQLARQMQIRFGISDSELESEEQLIQITDEKTSDLPRSPYD